MQQRKETNQKKHRIGIHKIKMQRTAVDKLLLWFADLYWDNGLPFSLSTINPLYILVSDDKTID